MKTKRKFFFTMLLLCFFASGSLGPEDNPCVSASGTVSNEPSFEMVSVGENIADSMDASEKTRRYRFTTDESDAFYWFTIKNTSEKTRLFYDLSEEKTFASSIVSGKQSIASRNTETMALEKLKKNHTYYVEISTSDGETGEYGFQLSKMEDDTPDEASNGTEHRINSIGSGFLESGTDTDYFRFTTDESNSFYRMTVNNESDETDLQYSVYADPECVRKVLSYTQTLQAKTSGMESFGKLEKNHAYYIKFSTSDKNFENSLKYRFHISSMADDYPDNTQEAMAFQADTTITGHLEEDMDPDYFRFSTDQSDAFYQFEVDNISEDADISCAVYSDAECISAVSPKQNGIEGKSKWNTPLGKLKKNHTYYVKVSGDACKYRIRVTKIMDDVRDTAFSATTLSLNRLHGQYRLQDATDSDFFQFTTSSFCKYNLKFTNLSSDNPVSCQIYSGKDCLDRQLIWEGDCEKKKSVPRKEAKLILRENRTYYIKIDGSSKGKYRLGINAAPPEQIKAKRTRDKKITIRWKDSNHSTGFEIFRSTKRNGAYKKIKTIPSGKASSFKDKKVKKDKFYCYKVRAILKKDGKVSRSAFSAIKAVG